MARNCNYSEKQQITFFRKAGDIPLSIISLDIRFTVVPLFCSMNKNQVIIRSTNPQLLRAQVISQCRGDARSRINLFSYHYSQVKSGRQHTVQQFSSNSSLLPEVSCRHNPAASSLQHCCSVPCCQVSARCVLQCRMPHRCATDAEIMKPSPTTAACTGKLKTVFNSK